MTGINKVVKDIMLRMSVGLVVSELFNYIVGLIKPTAGSCEITVVRRDQSPTGHIGEVYVDGKYVGMSCDNFINEDELFKHPVSIGFDFDSRVLKTQDYVITKGDFTAHVPYNTALLGSQNPEENDTVLYTLIEAVKGFKHIRLTVLNRPLIPLRSNKL